MIKSLFGKKMSGVSKIELKRPSDDEFINQIAEYSVNLDKSVEVELIIKGSVFAGMNQLFFLQDDVPVFDLASNDQDGKSERIKLAKKELEKIGFKVKDRDLESN